ncbi:DoxX family protein [Microlunatus antarcticus]|uniref:Putative membrane protein YphA (DoxX/SURF4 family) n=1 Tax=Microlunatus antarcticus TaxID=53388 RepID=A0A7W5JT33_9ACTN|nr:DoxX family protein [Microlunatus antarcticus]MBB3325753.1 putative membrane protein YphA (DoxX/SURF4 family) [Microlunatus antarcticus]
MSTAASAARVRPLTVATWIARAFLALVFLGAGASKLAGDPTMVAMFDQMGSGQWLRLLVGALEVAGAIGVLVPRLSLLAATGLALLMLSAAVTNVTVLDASPWTPLALLVVAGFAVWSGQRLARRRPLPSKA